MKKQLIKLGAVRTDLRQHIRPVLAELDKQGSNLTKKEKDFIRKHSNGRELFVDQDIYTSPDSDTWDSIQRKLDPEFIRETPAGKFVFRLP